MDLNTLKQVIFASTLVFISNHAFAIDASKVPKNKQSTTGLYFTSQEAFNHMAKSGKATLFVDVRDPAEIFTVGMPIAADTNVPFKRINLAGWSDKKSTFALKSNPDFFKGVNAGLKAKGLTNADTIILICGSGKRAAKTASALKKADFGKVYSIIDGYKGWQKAGLKWSKKLDKQKMSVK